MNETSSRITIEAFERLCSEQAPFIQLYGFRTEEIGWGTARVRLPATETHIRPGGTISGPSLMALADFTMYACILSQLETAEMAVTTNLTCNFLRKPSLADVIAEGRLLKLGRRLAVGEVLMTSVAEPDAGPVAHVTATYSLPPTN